MAALTPGAGSAFTNAFQHAGDSDGPDTYAVVSALHGLALEVAALREAHAPITFTANIPQKD